MYGAIAQDDDHLSQEKQHHEQQIIREQRRRTVASFLWRTFVATFGVASLFFGSYIAVFYLRSMAARKVDAWDRVNPGMYHQGRWDSNWLGLGLHFVGAAYMMLMGPLQFVKAIRRRCIDLHRWNGRLVILGTVLTSLGGMYYVCVSGMTLVKDLGKQANYANVVFGGCMLVCGFQTYRHAAWTKRIDQHQLWAYRVAGLCLGNIFLRLYLLWVSHFLSGTAATIAYSIISYIFFLPFVWMAGEVWRREQQEDDNKAVPTIRFLAATSVLLVLFVTGTTLQVLWNWLPYINFESLDQEEEDL